MRSWIELSQFLRIFLPTLSEKKFGYRILLMQQIRAIMPLGNYFNQPHFIYLHNNLNPIHPNLIRKKNIHFACLVSSYWPYKKQLCPTPNAPVSNANLLRTNKSIQVFQNLIQMIRNQTTFFFFFFCSV